MNFTLEAADGGYELADTRKTTWLIKKALTVSLIDLWPKS
jgi:hypothetical protein